VLVAAARTAFDRQFLGAGSILIAPKSPLTRTYLHRMDVFQLMEVVGLEEDFERHAAVGYRPMRQFEGQECHVVSRELSEAVSERCRASQSEKLAIHICLDEIAENVIFHARSASGGFAAAQSFRRRPELEIGIVDLGRGIRRSLKGNPRYADVKDDMTAIKTALKPMVTGIPDQNRGLGLSLTKFLLRENGGQLVVLSGNAAVYTGAVDGESVSSTRFPGTIVKMTIRTDQPLDLDLAYAHIIAAGYAPDEA
jgi:anti-sigma regulatory factor (Ser/Thr protein kinase)